MESKKSLKNAKVTYGVDDFDFFGQSKPKKKPLFTGQLVFKVWFALLTLPFLL